MKVCPMSMDTGPSGPTSLPCLETRCAWWVDEGACAVALLPLHFNKLTAKLDDAVSVMEGYDARGMLVRTTEA